MSLLVERPAKVKERFKFDPEHHIILGNTFNYFSSDSEDEAEIISRTSWKNPFTVKWENEVSPQFSYVRKQAVSMAIKMENQVKKEEIDPDFDGETIAYLDDTFMVASSEDLDETVESENIDNNAVREYACEYCPMKFQCKQSKWYHKTKKHKEEYERDRRKSLNKTPVSHNCRYCHKKFSNVCNRERHERNIHSRKSGSAAKNSSISSHKAEVIHRHGTLTRPLKVEIGYDMDGFAEPEFCSSSIIACNDLDDLSDQEETKPLMKRKSQTNKEKPSKPNTPATEKTDLCEKCGKTFRGLRYLKRHLNGSKTCGANVRDGSDDNLPGNFTPSVSESVKRNARSCSTKSEAYSMTALENMGETSSRENNRQSVIVEEDKRETNQVTTSEDVLVNRDPSIIEAILEQIDSIENSDQDEQVEAIDHEVIENNAPTTSSSDEDDEGHCAWFSLGKSKSRKRKLDTKNLSKQKESSPDSIAKENIEQHFMRVEETTKETKKIGVTSTLLESNESLEKQVSRKPGISACTKLVNPSAIQVDNYVTTWLTENNPPTKKRKTSQESASRETSSNITNVATPTFLNDRETKPMGYIQNTLQQTPITLFKQIQDDDEIQFLEVVKAIQKTELVHPTTPATPNVNNAVNRQNISNYVLNQSVVSNGSAPLRSDIEMSKIPLSAAIFQRAAQHRKELMVVWCEILEEDLIGAASMNPTNTILCIEDLETFRQSDSVREVLKQSEMVNFSVLKSDDTTSQWTLITFSEQGPPRGLANKLVTNYDKAEAILTEYATSKQMSVTNVMRFSKEGLFTYLPHRFSGKVAAYNCLW